MKRFILFLFMISPLFTFANNGSGLDDHEKKSIIVFLKNQLILQLPSTIQTKQEKGQFVYKSLSTHAEQTQQSLVSFLQKKKVDFQRFYLVNAIVLFDVDQNFIDEIKEREDIEKIIPNKPFKMLPEKNFPMDETFSWLFDEEEGSFGIGSNIEATKANKVWETYHVRGEGIVVAGQDTGVDWTHPALNSQYRGRETNGEINHQYSWHDAIRAPLENNGNKGNKGNKCGYNLKVPCDDDEHGTHTVGTMVGSDGVNNQVGMAPKAKWIACRNMDTGVGRPSTYIECFEWFLAPYPQGGDSFREGRSDLAPHVINNSWGCPSDEGCTGSEILPILKNLAAAGITVVVSAGNDGPDCGSIANPPAYHSEESLSVGAYNHQNGKIAGFSSRGPASFDGGIGPDVVAPGVSINSTIPGGGFEGGWNGTSMAGPHVAGMVALLWSGRKDLIGQIEKTTQIVRLSSTGKTSSESCGGVSGTKIPNNTFGFGPINVLKAMEMP